MSGKTFRHNFNQTIKNALWKGHKNNTVGAIEQKVGPWERCRNFPQDNAPANYPYQYVIQVIQKVKVILIINRKIRHKLVKNCQKWASLAIIWLLLKSADIKLKNLS